MRLPAQHTDTHTAIHSIWSVLLLYQHLHFKCCLPCILGRERRKHKGTGTLMPANYHSLRGEMLHIE